MTDKEYEQKRTELLDKRAEVESRLATIKDGISRAKRGFYETGERVDSTWLSNQEKYARRLGQSTQELQRQLGDLRASRHLERARGFETCLHEVLTERLGKEVTSTIFYEARRRQTED